MTLGRHINWTTDTGKKSLRAREKRAVCGLSTVWEGVSQNLDTLVKDLKEDLVISLNHIRGKGKLNGSLLGLRPGKKNGRLNYFKATGAH